MTRSVRLPPSVVSRSRRSSAPSSRRPRRTPVVLDGFITGAAALVATTIAPGLGPRLIASHRSPEPGHAVVIEQLELDPLLDLELRLGEDGAALALPVIRSATLLLAGMATFDSAGVSGPLPDAS